MGLLWDCSLKLLGPGLIGEFDDFKYSLAEIGGAAFECVHDETVESKEVHSAFVVDYLRSGNIHQLQELFSPKLNTVRTRNNGRSHSCTRFCQTIHLS
jgi:hypothetical protein